jgi:RHH-type proline utilization regulon transcriptional repressor/proline dehydrogenase/delta 1-pyrroline-5-carboxylate dehydrogenase
MTVTGPQVDTAAALARRWALAHDADEGPTARLAALVADPAGLELAVRFVDRVARPDDLDVAAHELAALRGSGATARRVLGPVDRALLAVGAVAAPMAPRLVVPLARARMHQLVGHLVADAGRGLGPHLAAARAAGFRLNLNLLGEAVLGETEALARLGRVQALAARPDVEQVSVKVSLVASQLSPWDVAGDAERVLRRLRVLAMSATRNGTAVTVDMEEFRDLELTVQVFTGLMADPDLGTADLGLAVQAYLPAGHDVVDRVTADAAARVIAGGTPVKIRLVKGANLSMERVEAELHGWPAAPYPSKAEVDASYVRLLDQMLDPDRTRYVRVGVASHNLFHVALAHVVASDRGVTDALDIEMLQGMAPAQARAVRDDAGRLLLYTPVVARQDADLAVAYLVRRLEETASPESFVRALLGGGAAELDEQEDAFRTSVRDARTVSTAPRRTARPAIEHDGFHNTPDTDPAGEGGRAWARHVLAHDVVVPAARALRSAADVDAAVARASGVARAWADTSPKVRAHVLRVVADRLEDRRDDLVAVMVAEAAKTVAEADPEVSEAVDFARYYADRAADLADGVVPGAVFRPDGVTVMTPPWNFPVAIPVGSVLAALAAGSPVIVKPAPQTPRCAAVAMAAVLEALATEGVPSDVLQVVDAPEDVAGGPLVSHPGVARVLLTGSIDTARLFAGWRPARDVIAETSGKNAIVVTPSADLDLAVADVVRSAFGHAGQKCSAASLLILVGSVGRSARFRRQLADATASLRVGPAAAPSTVVGPLVAPAAGPLLRALTTLDPGEAWLVRPRQLDEDGRLWTPGIKHGVAPGSFFHLTECFGPVLGVMRAETLDDAIALQNAVPFGLTGGLQSLDDAEIETWLDQVQVGNAYVNRHITGAIVQRQPFGGWKASAVGPGAKAGGPNYVAQLGRWADSPDVPTEDDAWLAWARADDRRVLAEEILVAHDPSGLDAESNVLRYRPVPHLTVRVGAAARERDVARVLAAAELLAVPVTLSRSPRTSDAAFSDRVASGAVAGRIRVVGGCAGLREAAVGRVGDVTVLDGPVLASGRRELLTVVREQSVSRIRHRFGHLTR